MLLVNINLVGDDGSLVILDDLGFMNYLAIALFSSVLLICTGSAFTSLEDLPQGEYYYAPGQSSGENNTPRSTRLSNPYIVLFKSGRIVTGFEWRSAIGAICFRGFTDGNQIVDMTQVEPPYGSAAHWQFQAGTAIDFDRYQRIDQTLSETDQEHLLSCIQTFGER